MVLKSRPIFVVESFLTERAFTAVKGDAKFETKYVKGVITKHLLNTPTPPILGCPPTINIPRIFS